MRTDRTLLSCTKKLQADGKTILIVLHESEVIEVAKFIMIS
jgi:excinuclease UvrABC ATPase subunit